MNAAGRRVRSVALSRQATRVLRSLVEYGFGCFRLIQFRCYGDLTAAARMRRRSVVNVIAELHRAGHVHLTRPARRVQESVRARRLALRLANLADEARNLGALGSAQRLDGYATRVAAAPTPATLRAVAEALADDANHANVWAGQEACFAPLHRVWRSATELASHPAKLRRRWHTHPVRTLGHPGVSSV